MIKVGEHITLDIIGTTQEYDPSVFERVINEIAKAAKVTILNISKYKFEPQGFTILALLAESHISFHTFPEKGDPSTLGRREILCDDGRNVAITKPQPRGTGRMVLSYEPKELLDSRELDIMRMRSMDAIRWVCRNTQLLFLGDITTSFQTHSARDLIHPGVEDNKNMSKMVLDILSDLMYYK